MANEFLEFLNLLGKLIAWIFWATLNTLAFLLFLIDCVALWRMPWIVTDVFDDFSGKKLRVKAVIHFALILVDIITVIPALLSLAAPTRWFHFCRILAKSCGSDRDYNDSSEFRYNFALRFQMWRSFFYCLSDLFAVTVGVIGAAVPTRMPAFFRLWGHFFDEYLEDDYQILRHGLMKNAALSLLDVITIPQGLIGMFMLPRTYHFFKGLRKAWHEYDDNYDEMALSGSVNVLRYNIGYRMECVMALWFGLFDIGCLFVGVLSMIAPTRIWAFFRIIYHDWDKYLEDDYCDMRRNMGENFVSALYEWLSFVHLLLCIPMLSRWYHIRKQAAEAIADFKPLDTSVGWSKEFSRVLRYNWRLRAVFIPNVYLGILDWLCFAFGTAWACLCPLTRLYPYLKSFGDHWEDYKKDDYFWWRFKVAVIGLLIAFVDWFALISFVIAICSLIRAFPLIGDLRKHNTEEYNYWKDAEMNYNWQWRLDTVRHAGFVLIDAIFLPMFLVTCLSGYLAVETVFAMKDTGEWTEDRMMEIRKLIFVNFFMFWFDTILLSLPFVVVFCTFYRLPHWGAQVKHSWKVWWFNRAQDLEKKKATQPDADTSTFEDRENFRAQFEHKPLPEDSCRVHLLRNLAIIGWDLFVMFPCFIFVVITLYRSCALFRICCAKKEDEAVSASDSDGAVRPIEQRGAPKNSRLNRNGDVETDDSYYEADVDWRIDVLEIAYLVLCDAVTFIVDVFEFVFMDVPCAIIGVFVFATLWRASTLWKEVFTWSTDRGEKRMAALMQFVLFWRDFLFFFPFAILCCTFWRLPFLGLGFMAKWSKPKLTEAALEILEVTMVFPAKGYVKWVFRARKRDPNAVIARDACDCKMFVLSTRFWQEVVDKFGGMANSAQGFLPTPLALTALDDGLFTQGVAECNFELQVTKGKVKRSTILKNVVQLRGDIPCCLQIEHAQLGVVCSMVVPMQKMVDCASNLEGSLLLEDAVHSPSEERLTEVRGTEFSGIVNAFWIIVAMEFVQWLIDLTHAILFFGLLLLPWRWLQMLVLLNEHPLKRKLRQDRQCIGMLEHAHSVYVRLTDFLFEPSLNDMMKSSGMRIESIKSKEGFTGFSGLSYGQRRYFDATASSVISQWVHRMQDQFWEYERELMRTSQATDEFGLNLEVDIELFDRVVHSTHKKLQKIKPDPPVTAKLLPDFVNLQMNSLYCTCLKTAANVAGVKDKVDWELLSILREQIHERSLHYKERIDHVRETVHASHKQLQEEVAVKSSKKCCHLFGKGTGTLYKQIRESWMKGLLDIGAVLTLALLLITMYRLLPLCRDLFALLRMRYVHRNDERTKPSLRFGFACILKQQSFGLWNDISLSVQIFGWSLLIFATLVRSVDYISDLADGGRRLGLRGTTLRTAVKIGQANAEEILPDLHGLFDLFFAWKTYKFAVASLVFSIFLPAAGLMDIFALLCTRVARRLRQILGMCMWFGLVGITFWVLFSVYPSNGVFKSKPNHSALFAILVVVSLTMTASLLAFFGCVHKYNDGKSPFERANQKAVAASVKHSVALPRSCPECHQKLAFDLRPPNGLYQSRCGFCESWLSGTEAYFCETAHCEAHMTGKIYCSRCSEMLQLATEKQLGKAAAAAEPGAVEDSATVLFAFPEDEYVARSVRFSWPNLLAIFGSILEVSTLFAVVAILHSHSYPLSENGDLDKGIFGYMLSFSRIVLLSNIWPSIDSFATYGVILVIVGFLWVVLISLPLVTQELFDWVHDKGTFTRSVMWYRSSWLFTRVFYVWLLAQWLSLLQCEAVRVEDSGDWKMQFSSMHSAKCWDKHGDFRTAYGNQIAAFFLVVFFLTTTAVVTVYNFGEVRHSRRDNLDVRFPLAYTHLLQSLQSLYLLVTVLLAIDSAKASLNLACVLSIAMFIWNAAYWRVSKHACRESAESLEREYGISSVATVAVLRIALYALLCYAVCVLCMHSHSLVSDSAIGVSIVVGWLLIAAVAVVFGYAYHKLAVEAYIARFRQSTLGEAVTELIEIYEESSQNGAAGDWFEKVARANVEKLRNDPHCISSPQDFADFLMEMERHIVYERLSSEFLAKRGEWIGSCLECEHFEDCLSLTQKLAEAIRDPPFFSLAMDTLTEETMFRRAPMDVCLLLLEFVVDTGNTADFCRDTLLHENTFPQFQITGEILQRILEYGRTAEDRMESFVERVRESEALRAKEVNERAAERREELRLGEQLAEAKQRSLAIGGGGGSALLGEADEEIFGELDVISSATAARHLDDGGLDAEAFDQDFDGFDIEPVMETTEVPMAVVNAATAGGLTVYGGTGAKHSDTTQELEPVMVSAAASILQTMETKEAPLELEDASGDSVMASAVLVPTEKVTREFPPTYVESTQSEEIALLDADKETREFATDAAAVGHSDASAMASVATSETKEETEVDPETAKTMLDDIWSDVVGDEEHSDSSGGTDAKSGTAVRPIY